MRLAESARIPWWTAAVAALALLRPATPALIEQHVLFRAGATPWGRPLFHLAHGDARDRWRVIDAPLGAFAGDGDIEDVVVTPVTSIANAPDDDSCPIETP